MNSEISDQGFRARLEQLIGDEKPFPWAIRIGLSPGVFNRMWNEKKAPKADVLSLISQKTGVSIDWLLTGEGPMTRGEGVLNQAIGEAIVQGKSIDTEEIHIDVHNHIANEKHEKYSVRDPLDDAFLKDWHKLSEVNMMRFWTLLKEEIAKGEEE